MVDVTPVRVDGSDVRLLDKRKMEKNEEVDERS